jgi:hypothetical protein
VVTPTPVFSPERGDNSQPTTTVAGCLVQLAWHILGASALLIVWITILRGSRWSIGVKDGVYWAVVLGMIVARYVDVSRMNGRTTAGQPATLRDVRRYAWLLLLVAAVAWTFAQSVDA